jgi:hypothetical protein
MMTAWLVLAALVQPGDLIDRTLAIVGGRTITLSDARTAVALGLVEGSSVSREVVDRLVDRELMLREADRYEPPEPTPAAIEARLAEVGGRLGSAGERARALASGGFSETRLRAWIRDDLRVAGYLQQRFTADERRQDLIVDWIADLRRRTEIVLFEP